MAALAADGISRAGRHSPRGRSARTALCRHQPMGRADARRPDRIRGRGGISAFRHHPGAGPALPTTRRAHALGWFHRALACHAATDRHHHVGGHAAALSA